MLANLSKELQTLVAKDGESIEAIVVGKHDKARYGAPAGDDENVLIPVEAGLAKIDQDYDAGYGGADCYPFYAWTQTKVWFVAEYDGATCLTWVPRHPIDLEPEFSGQSS